MRLALTNTVEFTHPNELWLTGSSFLSFYLLPGQSNKSDGPYKPSFLLLSSPKDLSTTPVLDDPQGEMTIG